MLVCMYVIIKSPNYTYSSYFHGYKFFELLQVSSSTAFDSLESGCFHMLNILLFLLKVNECSRKYAMSNYSSSAFVKEN